MGSEHGLDGLPYDEVRTGLDSCRDCHSSGQTDFRIAFDVAADRFPRHHGEGDEFRRSPHKSLGCTACHDPHKSIWKKEGGLKDIDEHDAQALGNMCLRCHNGRPLANGIVLPAVKMRGAHGEMGLRCMDCHMQEWSSTDAAGATEAHRHTHLWRINSTALPADANYEKVGTTNYWKNSDGSLGWSPEKGVAESFVTLDMVCSRCHQNRTVEQLSAGAKYIHRQPGLVDLTVNGGDSLQIVKKATPKSKRGHPSPSNFPCTRKSWGPGLPRRPTGTFSSRSREAGPIWMARRGRAGLSPGARTSPSQQSRKMC